MSVFVDTGVLFGFLHEDDHRHDAATAVVKAIAEGAHGTPVVSDYVVDELFTLVRTQTGNAALEAAAVDLLPFPDPELPGLLLFPVAPHHLDATMATFQRYRDQGLSFTDASHLVLMEAYGVDTLATFDTGFQGLAKLIPETEEG